MYLTRVIISPIYFIIQVPSSGLHHLKSSIKTLNCVCPQARCFDSLAMDAATTASGPQASPGKSSFDQKVETRAEWHEQLRGRNNVTSCRSPTRESETLRIKTELKEKRHLDFLRRRSVSPEAPGVARCRNCSSKLKFSPRRRRNSKAGFPDSCTSNGRPVTMSTQANASNGQRSDRWVKLNRLTMKTLISHPVTNNTCTCFFPPDSCRLHGGQKT